MPNTLVKGDDQSDYISYSGFCLAGETNCADLADLPKREVICWERTFQGLCKIAVLFKDGIKMFLSQ